MSEEFNDLPTILISQRGLHAIEVKVPGWTPAATSMVLRIAADTVEALEAARIEISNITTARLADVDAIAAQHVSVKMVVEGPVDLALAELARAAQREATVRSSRTGRPVASISYRVVIAGGMR